MEKKEYMMCPKICEKGLIIEIMGERDDGLFLADLVFDNEYLIEVYHNMGPNREYNERIEQILTSKKFKYDCKTDLFGLTDEILTTFKFFSKGFLNSEKYFKENSYTRITVSSPFVQKP